MFPIVPLFVYKIQIRQINKTDEKEGPQEAQPAWENISLGFIEAVYQW